MAGDDFRWQWKNVRRASTLCGGLPFLSHVARALTVRAGTGAPDPIVSRRRSMRGAKVFETRKAPDAIACTREISATRPSHVGCRRRVLRPECTD